MKELPESEVYEDSLGYWPYQSSVAKVVELVRERTPREGTLLDIMCGPGYLLGKIAKIRSDLSLAGVDIDDRYIAHGRAAHPGIDFEKGDVLDWKPQSPFDMVLCTGSLHHIPYEQQETAVAGMASMAKPGGLVIISDCYIDDYSNEIERKAAAAKLGYEYLKVTIENGAPDSVVGWTVDILWNDVLMQEFKTSLTKRLPILEKRFARVETLKTWPEAESGYGDYIHLCIP